MADTYTVPDFGPSDLLTNPKEGFRRVRVDVAQTGFFLGRQGRVHRELSIHSGQTITFRFTTAVNTIIMANQLSIDSGSVRMRIYTAGTPSGAFTETLTPILQNRMTSRPLDIYELQNTMQSGAVTIGGAVPEDAIRVVAASATAQQSSVGGSQDDVRGIPGNFVAYYELTNIGNNTVNGVWRYIWEERP